MSTTKKMVTSALFIALGVTLGSVFYIPIGVAKAFPMQHLINVLSAVVLGPFYAVANAFLISLLRNMMGTGSLLAFPGSMIGALLAAMLYAKSQKMLLAMVGEVIGTGLIGALLAYPIAKLLLGSDKAATFFILPFGLSSLAGALIGFALLKVIYRHVNAWLSA